MHRDRTMVGLQFTSSIESVTRTNRFVSQDLYQTVEKILLALGPIGHLQATKLAPEISIGRSARREKVPCLAPPFSAGLSLTDLRDFLN